MRKEKWGDIKQNAKSFFFHGKKPASKWGQKSGAAFFKLVENQIFDKEKLLKFRKI